MDTANQKKITPTTYDQALERLQGLLSTADGSTFNLCAQIFEIINEAETENQPKLFKEVAILYESIDSVKTDQVPISPFETQEKSLQERYGQIVNTFIDYMTNQLYDVETFYRNIWETIQNDIFFPTMAAKVFAFYFILIDKRIPYFELQQGYQMSNSSFKELRKKYFEILQKIRFISTLKIRQKTERASLLLNELGITIPESDAPVEIINAYEQKLIIMVEAIQYAAEKRDNLDRILRQIDRDEE